MDDADFRLLARLVREPLAPLRELARDAELSPNAARARIDRLREDGVLFSTHAQPHASLFGRLPVMAVYPPRSLVDAEAILRVEDVWFMSVNHDGQVAVTWMAPAADAPPPPALDAALGGAPARSFVRGARPLSPPGAALSREQWRLARAMVPDARASHRALAAAADLSERVVARQREKLVAGGYLQPVTGILSNLAKGIVLFHLYAQGSGARREADIARAVGDFVPHVRTDAPVGVYAFCRAPSFGDALASADRVRALPGIEHVEIILERDAAIAVERIQAWCERAASLAPSPARW